MSTTDEKKNNISDAETNLSAATLNESQDFHLIDSDEEGFQGQSGGMELSKDENSDSVLKKNAEESHSNTTRQPILEKTVVAEKSDAASKEDCHEKEIEEDEIQGTPPESYVSTKKQGLSSIETIGLKRKAEFNEPVAKLLRMSSREDAIHFEKKRAEEEENCESYKIDDTQQDFSRSFCDTSIIIAETQDPEEEKPVHDTVKNSTEKDDVNKQTKLQETHSYNTQQNEKESYEVDKNENLNELTKLNDNVVVSNHDKQVTPAIISDNVGQASGNMSIQVEEKLERTKTTLTPDEKTTVDLINDDESKIEAADTLNKPDLKNQDNTVENHVPAEERDNIDVKLKSDNVALEQNTLEDKPVTSSNLCASRMSIEVLYDRAAIIRENKSKPKEIVEIDEDEEKIVLDSSQEDDGSTTNSKNMDKTNTDTIYKSCYDSKNSSEYSYKSISCGTETSTDKKLDSNLVNGSSESKKCDTDGTASMGSDIFSGGSPAVSDKGDSIVPSFVHSMNKQSKANVSMSKDSDNADLLSVSDNEPDISIVHDDAKNKSDLVHSNLLIKSMQVEKEIGVYLRLKCLLQIDEGTKEFLGKELMTVHCEPIIESTVTRQRNDDTLASLADISGNDNKETSPGSVNSNPQPYVLHPSRLSFVSTISSSSSASSAASLAIKLASRDNTHFSLPRVPAKHIKKHYNDVPPMGEKQTIDESYERLTKEWKNNHLLTTTILSYVNAELNAVDAYNVSNERLDDQLQKIRSSTPETLREEIEATTPKSTRRNKTLKRPRSKSSKASTHSNGLNTISTNILNSAEKNSTPNSRKKNKIESTDNTIAMSNVNTPTKVTSQSVIVDELIGKEVFAKWSDKNYYPGMVTDKIKTKYKVSFYDGKTKVLIEDFVIPIPKTLNEGLSVYATTKNEDYGSCGIIVDVQTTNNDVYYIVETDEGEKIKVQVRNIFLSSDQAQVLKEEMESDRKSLLSTPKHLGQVSLDNMVDGKRRSKRIATPVFNTPKSKLDLHSPAIRKTNVAEPSVSGVTTKPKIERTLSFETDGISSDASGKAKEGDLSNGVQPEIIGTPNAQIAKGPQHRIKSKPRSKKRSDDEETIETLGPIPNTNSTIFKGMSFILTCASVESIDRYQVESKDSGSDAGTENEEEWVQTPFVRDRLQKQIIAGGGKVYTDFNLVPKDEYKDTKLITNVPNSTAKSLLCLSVGIPAYNHKWIIRCCQQNEVINAAEDKLPSGWSLEKKSYIEMFQRPSNKPLTQVIVIIPTLDSNKEFAPFWRTICENAGAVVLLADCPETIESFVEGTVILTNHRCPTWVVTRANELQIPMLSTTWIIQCLIEGKVCHYNNQPRYKYNFIQN